MAENTRRVTIDNEGRVTGGLKPMPAGSAPKKTAEELEEAAKMQAELQAERQANQKYQAEKGYKQSLESYKRGDAKGAGFGFKPKPEDAKEADDAFGSARGQRSKFFGDLDRFEEANEPKGLKKGGKVKKMAAGGTASKRADGIAQRGKTRGKIC